MSRVITQPRHVPMPPAASRQMDALSRAVQTLSPALAIVSVSIGSISGVWTPDLSIGQQFNVTLTGDLTINNPVNYTSAGDWLALILQQDGAGSHTVTWGSQLVDRNVTPPQPSSTALSYTSYLFLNIDIPTWWLFSLR